MKIRLTDMLVNKITLIKALREPTDLSLKETKALADKLQSAFDVEWPGPAITPAMSALGIVEPFYPQSPTTPREPSPYSYKAMLDRLDDLRLLLPIAMQAHPFSKSEGIRYRRALLDLKDIIPAARHWSVAYDRSRKAR